MTKETRRYCSILLPILKFLGLLLLPAVAITLTAACTGFVQKLATSLIAPFVLLVITLFRHEISSIKKAIKHRQSYKALTRTKGLQPQQHRPMYKSKAPYIISLTVGITLTFLSVISWTEGLVAFVASWTILGPAIFLIVIGAKKKKTVQDYNGKMLNNFNSMINSGSNEYDLLCAQLSKYIQSGLIKIVYDDNEGMLICMCNSYYFYYSFLWHSETYIFWAFELADPDWVKILTDETNPISFMTLRALKILEDFAAALAYQNPKRSILDWLLTLEDSQFDTLEPRLRQNLEKLQSDQNSDPEKSKKAAETKEELEELIRNLHSMHEH